MNLYFLGQLFEAVFAVGGFAVFIWAMRDFFAGETTKEDFDDHEMTFIPKSIQKYF